MEDAISKLVENRANTRGKEKESPEGGKEKEKGKEEKKEPRGSVLNEAGELVIRLVLPDRGEKEGDIPKRKKKLIKPSLSGLINKLTKK